MNGHGLPAELRIPTTGGDFRLFRLEQGVLTLKSGGRFTLYFRYYHQLVQSGTRPTTTPVLSDAQIGTYKFERDKLLLTPIKRDRSPSRGSFAASVAGEEIRASYLLVNGTLRSRVTLVLRRDPNFW